MSADEIGDRPPVPDEPTNRAGSHSHVGRLFSFISYLIGLPVITLLGSLVVGYYQYLNASQEKIRAQAETEMQMATKAVMDISRTFAEVQTLQRAMFRDFVSALDDNTGVEEQALATRHAKNVWENYEANGLALLQAGDMMARNAEIYVDWATEPGRKLVDARRRPNSDPLTSTLLKTYDFDCDNILPAFVPAPGNTRRRNPPSTCSVDAEQYSEPEEFIYDICPRRKDVQLPAVRIHWFSAKHQVMTMHYCFDALHQRLAKVRAWASQGEPTPAIKLVARTEREQLSKDLDTQASRLDAFTGLALNQIETVRVKYSQVSFPCLLLSFTAMKVDDACIPVEARPYEVLREITKRAPNVPNADKQPKT
jgi:hypothetical protein